MFYSLHKTQIRRSQAGTKLLMEKTKRLLQNSNADMGNPQTTTAVPTEPHCVVKEKYVPN